MVLLLSACGSDGGLTEISGVVSYAGQPVQKGSINFLPSDGKGPTAAAIIAGGKYSVKVAPGRKQVTVEGHKIVGQRHLNRNDPRSPIVDTLEQILPERYNTKTELTREISSSAVTYDFALEK